MIVILLIVLIPVLVIVISASVISFVRAFVDRILFYKQIKQICKGKKYKISFNVFAVYNNCSIIAKN